MEHIKGCLRKGPINYRSQLEDEWDSEIGPVCCRTVNVEGIDEETASSNLWKTHFDLVGTQTEVDAPEKVEKFQKAVVLELIAIVARFAVIYDLAIHDLRAFLALTH